MTPDQFDALSTLLRLRGGPAQEFCRLHYVEGLPVAKAAQQVGISPQSASNAQRRIAEGLALVARIADAKLLAQNQ